MSYHYSNPKREADPHALPDIETFEVVEAKGWLIPDQQAAIRMDEDQEPLEPGWYWWSCFPGCLPDSDPIGPFATEQEALADAQEGMDEDEED